MTLVEPFDPAEVGARMKLVRKLLGMSQQDFADKLGTSPQNVRHWEAGNQRPTIPQVSVLVADYRLTLDWIYLGRWHSLPADVAAWLGAVSPQH